MRPTIRQDSTGAGTADEAGGAEVLVEGGDEGGGGGGVLDVVSVGVDVAGGGVDDEVSVGADGGGAGAGCEAPPVFWVELTVGGGLVGGGPGSRFRSSTATRAIRPASSTAPIAASIAVRRRPEAGRSVVAGAVCPGAGHPGAVCADCPD
jgi:hypothetical protein